jgi:serine/threonine protein kinase/tetratricopeptide (TPR) repeat protein
VATDKRREISRLYLAALKYPVDERRAFLEAACRGDEEIRGEIEMLLGSDETTAAFPGAEAEAVSARRLDNLQTASGESGPPRSLAHTVGRYRLDRELGRGGMGVVYAAHDGQLERAVAIKMLRPATTDAQARKRFWREARAGARIRHPNVCHLYEIAEHNDELFLVMELLEGESLAQRLTRGPLQVVEAVEISLQILSALEALHKEALIHRDLKPSNIFLTPHGAKVLDFGLAQTTGSDPLRSEITKSLLTAPGTIVGTPPYMAPEQFRGEPTDARTDLFALGAVIFEMLTGTRAFPGNTPMEVYHQTMYEQPPAVGGSPAAAVVGRVIRRALAKNSGDRFSSAAQMAEALRAACGVEDTGETRAHPIGRLIVLPFRILKPDPETDFLALSVPDAITHALTGLQSVVVRSSAAAVRFAAEALDWKRIAEEADVDVVLAGSLLRAADRIQVAVQLVKVPDGTVLWSYTPQVTLRDVFQLQDQIVAHIVESLSLSLTAREHRRLKADVPTSPTAYEFFLRGNQLVLVGGVMSAENLSAARELYNRCLEGDPRYAPAWVRLGRCLWLIGKGGEDRNENAQRAEECFQRALELNPELPLAHNVYALFEIDQGRAQDAMVRLVRRARSGTVQAELYAALVQACRFCGLLGASVAAHERARQLDRTVLTSVDHTYWQLHDYDRILEYTARQYHGQASITNQAMRALIFGEQGNREEAIRQLREIERGALTEYMRAQTSSIRALFEGQREESLKGAERVIAQFPDPETVCFHARVLAYFGERDRALAALNQALDRGFILYRILTRSDPWLDPVRPTSAFADLLSRAESRYRDAVAAFRNAGGDDMLGVSAG